MALEWAAEINAKSPTAQRMLKYAFNLIDDGLVGQQLFAGEATRLAYGSDEAAEGRDAFLDKREPDWSAYPVPLLIPAERSEAREMAVIPIDHPDDPRLAVFRQNDRGLSNRPARRDDDAPGMFIAEGDLVVERALDAGCRPLAALVDVDNVPAVAGARHRARPCSQQAPSCVNAIARMGRVQPIVAVFERPPRPSR